MPPTRSTSSDPAADPDFAERYRAMSSRDTRFDGQFITGVHSTGIYCRPSCPATTPKAANVSFYLTSAAAHEAGLRACKRCLPDAVPGSPAWNLRDDLAGRAMRLIGDGLVERDGVAGLAARLGYTPRHLTRVLVAELGAGPLALARANRAQTARMLLVNTELPITDVAFAAGFGSVRQFNDTITAVYERTPTALRQGVRHPLPAGAGGLRAGGDETGGTDTGGTRLTIQLPVRGPFDGLGLLRFLAARALPGIETIEHTATDAAAPVTGYGRTLRLPHGPATIDLTLVPVGGGTATAPGVTCSVWVSSLADLAPLVSRVRRLLDLDADALAIDRALAQDPLLAPFVARTPGIRVPGSTDPEETLFRALIGQQVSVAAARTALSRLSAELGEDLPAPAHRAGSGAGPGLVRLFPTATAIADHGRAVLRGPAARVATILQTAEALRTGELELSPGDTREDLSKKLQARAGIGPWTAGYVAMRVLGSPDILLTSDLALRQGAGRIGLPITPAALAAHGAAWAPWRSYAGMHLWNAYK
ncbi:DNA-3-methyladenine glycosylase 2 family protein [Cryobacterium melibiosiphilum]|uniref:DNA-3-methyladenine glycosylase II n=1 Tax=Cryobacterium melibiosiphilum TaxID=995039 RepID=A0A3A5MHH0_9MICO|nr:AlkA N-terminal domain-containing protein [Cryobacterium melibiosiphilum]RJT87369.1 DNA-3-methyladenine glycosylase 2 family protein [Cryobacterium melibiosiphilum]